MPGCRDSGMDRLLSYLVLFPRLQLLAKVFELFLQLHVLGIRALDIEALLPQAFAIARAGDTFERGRIRAHALAVIFKHSLDRLRTLRHKPF